MAKYTEIIKARFAEKKKSLEENPAATEDELACLAITEKFLRYKDAFAVSQPIMSLVVLKFLGYSDEEIKDLYFKLAYEQITGNQYRYVDPDNLPEDGGVDTKPSFTAPQSSMPDIPDTDDDTDLPEEPAPSPDVTDHWEVPLEKPRSNPRMGRLVYWEDGKRCTTDPLVLDPGCETYYYTKYCFGKKDADGRLHTLVGNEWRYGGPFRAYYFDAQYDCWEVDYILEETQ